MRTTYYIKAIQEALTQAMEADETVFLMGEDIGVYGGCFGVTRGMLRRFGKKRVVETPMSEASLLGVAIGAAVTGLKPVLEIMFMDFITLCMDQIVNHASKMRYIYGGTVSVPLVIRTAAGAGKRYASSHSQSLEAMFMNVPGLKIAAPSTPYDAKGLLKAAIDDPDPVLFVEHKLLYWTKGHVPREPYTLPFGVAATRRHGNDVTIVAHSRMVSAALAASETLAKEGVDAEVIDLRTLSPLDTDTITASVEKTGRLVTVEEGYLCNGIGAEISARVAERAFPSLKAPIVRVGGADVPIPYSPPLEDAAIPQTADIVRAVRTLFKWRFSQAVAVRRAERSK
jgi:pyruvate/2-oxoglutarate/acetoin dehydrogenase E1 component